RITCRDWFHLCLKQGLTVYRDQEFTSDERSRAVKRIQDVRTLRSAQFPEDGGPLAHPARPDQYREINNFYTATVYEKGAEIVRMLATLLGQDRFRAGMDLYFERHDGQATTIEAFLTCFEDANAVDLSAFGRWYTQAGTPAVTIGENYDAASGLYELTIRQKTDPTPGQPDKVPMVMPIRFGLVGPNGADMNWQSVSGGRVDGDMIVLEGESATLTFSGLGAKPVASLFRGFSAPVRLASERSEAALLFLARHDSDPFNRWQALQDVAMTLMLADLGGRPWVEQQIGPLAAAVADTAQSDTLDDAFKALALTLPALNEVARSKGQDVDPAAIEATRARLITDIESRIGPDLEALYHAKASTAPFSPDAVQAGQRALRNAALALLVKGGAPVGPGLASAQYHTAQNMTDRLAALSAAVSRWTSDAPGLLGDFRTMFTSDPLVFDKWLTLNALPTHDETLDRIKAILSDPDFPRNNPNRLRALVGAFAMNNLVQFARPDGLGFRFVCDFVSDVDQRNPQVAARVLTGFRIWRSLEPNRRAAAEAALRDLAEKGGLSRNTADILTRTLQG
ncbi:MAG: DUF3458 domain-containing protein, partial [Devosia sp.]